MGFVSDITAFVKKTGAKADVVFKKVAFDAFSNVVEASPVDTGRFRGSWRVGVNREDLSVENEKTTKSNVKVGDSLGQDELAISQEIEQAVFGDTILITNNLPYGPPLNSGSSQQAPADFVETALVLAQNSLAKAAAAA